jgi:manganese/iron transport system substrate-binding protein
MKTPALSPFAALRLGLTAPLFFWLAACVLGLGATALRAELTPAADAAALPAPPPPAERIRVLTTFTILADMAREVAGPYAEVESLTRPGAEIHGYEPTPRDILKTRRADLVLWNGLNLEVWFEKFFADVKNVPSAVLTVGIEPIPIGVGPYAGKPNPHAWMSPANALIYVENIRAALAARDPRHAAAYAAQAAAYAEKIRALDAPIREQLARVPADSRTLVTSEGAFSYLCRAYDLRELYLWPINADAQGTPQQIRAVIDTVRRDRVPVIFSESTVSDKPARQVARETGARYGGVLYVDSLTDASGPAPTYLALLETNARTLLQGFLGPQSP